jgi:hypothetical protein
MFAPIYRRAAQNVTLRWHRLDTDPWGEGEPDPNDPTDRPE